MRIDHWHRSYQGFLAATLLFLQQFAGNFAVLDIAKLHVDVVKSGWYRHLGLMCYTEGAPANSPVHCVSRAAHLLHLRCHILLYSPRMSILRWWEVWCLVGIFHLLPFLQVDLESSIFGFLTLIPATKSDKFWLSVICLRKIIVIKKTKKQTTNKHNNSVQFSLTLLTQR